MTSKYAVKTWFDRVLSNVTADNLGGRPGMWSHILIHDRTVSTQVLADRTCHACSPLSHLEMCVYVLYMQQFPENNRIFSHVEN